MTDKEIIIDGVNVAGCEDFKPKDRFTCHPYICNCHQKPDCNYKQLRRKEQECEESKRTISTLEGVNKLFENNLDNSFIKIVRYKQALKKIEKIAETSNNAPCLEFDCDCTQCKDETTDNGNTCMQYGLEKILDIVNEVKGDTTT